MEYDHISDLDAPYALAKNLNFPTDLKTQRRFGKNLVHTDGEDNYFAE